MLSLALLLDQPCHPDRPLICLGLEGSANKLGAGVLCHHPSGETTVLSNVRHTYITPPGEGFQPTDTARHHREWAVSVVRDAMLGAGIGWDKVDVIAYTKGASWLSDWGVVLAGLAEGNSR